MNINDLTLAEQHLHLRVVRVLGSMEEKHEQLQQSGVYAEYGRIFKTYVELIESEQEGLEALKRAIFLLWYEQAEPSCFSGVFGLPKKTTCKVLEALERRVEAGELDFELKWMLPYYNAVAEWVFEQHADLLNLQSFLSKTNPKLWERAQLKAENFTNRGQLGKYWLSLR